MRASRFVYVLTGLALVLGIAFSGIQPAIAVSEAEGEIGRDMLYMPGEVIVGFTEGQPPRQYVAQALALAGEVGAQVAEVSGNTALLRFAPDTNVQAMVEQITVMAGVGYAEPNYISWIPEDRDLREPEPVSEVKIRLNEVAASATRGQPPVEAAVGSGDLSMVIRVSELQAMRSIRNGQSVPTFPTDTRLWENWAWDYVRADLIWTDKSINPIVCVVDTGVDVNHPDLKGRVINGRDFVDDDEVPNIPDDDNGHGTHVAGTIAAISNNKRGIAGVANAKVLAVKVLSSQGWGTTFDIAQGIRYCADNPAVKVINMSLGSFTPDNTEYNALVYAIVTKGKLVVAAAGNDSTTQRFYPAGWSDDAVIGDGLIAVAASRPPDSQMDDDNHDGRLWVDVNGDGVEDEGEKFSPDQCAADFTNYGSWVEMIAPGEGVLSTLPVSYTYYNKFFRGSDVDNDGYGLYDGTSMSAPHVAGAAARAWSVFPLYTNVQIAQRLWETGEPPGDLWLAATDPNLTDASLGYAGGGYLGEAPFCWPDGSKGSDYSMEGARYLNVARAMDRGALLVMAVDATNGMPLQNAVVYAYDAARNALRDRAIVSRDSSRVILINLPGDGADYNILLNKSYYTYGSVWIGHAYNVAGYVNTAGSLWVGVPRKGKITAVANWGKDIDLDLYLWLPNFSSPGGVVGYKRNPGLGLNEWEGDLSDYPRARWNREGGSRDWMGMESVSIALRPGYSSLPYYNQTPSDAYHFLLHDMEGGGLNGYVILRLWANGKIIGVSEASPVACAGGEPWWYAGYMQLGTYTDVGLCGDGAPPPAGIWPYANGHAVQSLSEQSP